jgi:hypothetical protein
MLERPSVCPACLSKYSDIRGMTYGIGQYIGDPCTDDWHKGANYNPSELVLTDYDRDMFAAIHIKI